MFRSFNASFITAAVSGSAIVAATLVGGVAIFLISSAETNAKPLTSGGVVQTFAKGDRLAVLKKGAACSSQPWPYYEPRCQFDVRRPFSEMPTVRIIALR
jgi:hypothetical protein